MDTKDSGAPAPLNQTVQQIPRSESQVLFDDDYRKHISRLNSKLERERREVIILRERIIQMEDEMIDLQSCINMLKIALKEEESKK